MKDALIVSALSLVPRKTGARAMGAAARRPLSRLLTRAFVRAYKVDMSEAAEPITSYPTLEALFTRTLREGARPIDDAPQAVVSPVDGRCAAVGRTVDGRLPLTDKRQLDLRDLLGPLAPAGELDVAVLYLSPKDYHRVHVAREGALRAWSYLPGTLWPVFPAAVRRVDGLFSRNERVVVEQIEGDQRWYSVLVGAFGVGRIALHPAELITNTGAAGAHRTLDPVVPLDRGAPLGVFHLGSTVVMAAPAGQWELTVRPDEVVRMGRRIGHLAETV